MSHRDASGAAASSIAAGRLRPRLIVVPFLALATYVAFEPLRTLFGGAEAGSSAVGIALAAASLAIMPALSRAQRRAGRAPSSGSVLAGSTQTLACSYLSAVLLAGLVANSTLGWPRVDPAVALVLAAAAAREGVAAWRGNASGDPSVGAQGEKAAVDMCCTGRNEARRG